MCCLKNTHSPGADRPTSQLLEGYLSFLRVRNSRDSQSLLPRNIFYEFFTKLDDIFTLRLLYSGRPRESVRTYRTEGLCTKSIAVLAPSSDPS